MQLQDASITRTYDFSTGPRDGAAIDTPFVTMTYDVQDVHGSITVNASGHYDATHRLVTNLHVETKSTTVSGPLTTGSDFKLQSPAG